MQDVTYRKVLHDDKKGRQKVEVEQLAGWKFLMFSGSFATRLFVFQDKKQRTVGAGLQHRFRTPPSACYDQGFGELDPSHAFARRIVLDFWCACLGRCRQGLACLTSH